MISRILLAKSNSIASCNPSCHVVKCPAFKQAYSLIDQSLFFCSCQYFPAKLCFTDSAFAGNKDDLCFAYHAKHLARLCLSAKEPVRMSADELPLCRDCLYIVSPYYIELDPVRSSQAFDTSFCILDFYPVVS